MFSQNLKYIKKELNKYTDKNHEDLLAYCIKDKLDTALLRYNKEMDLNSEYVLTRSSLKVLKAITKLQKKADKQALEDAAEGENDYE